MFVLVGFDVEDSPVPIDPHITPCQKPQPPLFRWECACRRPPVLLAMFDLHGHIEIAHQERYWHVDGRIATNCPMCGKQHLLELRIDPAVIAELPQPWREDRR